MSTTKDRQAMLAALSRFISQRSGIDGRNYAGSREAFMGDYRPMLKNGRQAKAMLRAVELRPSITADDLEKASRAYSGRLQFNGEGENVSIEYTTGQYFPTEYRKAVCAVLSQALWDYWAADSKDRQEITRKARRELGIGIARDWFK